MSRCITKTKYQEKLKQPKIWNKRSNIFETKKRRQVWEKNSPSSSDWSKATTHMPSSFSAMATFWQQSQGHFRPNKKALSHVTFFFHTTIMHLSLITTYTKTKIKCIYRPLGSVGPTGVVCRDMCAQHVLIPKCIRWWVRWSKRSTVHLCRRRRWPS